MELDTGHESAPGLTQLLSTSLHPIPFEGLREVLSAWSGRGELLNALAAIADDEGERSWSELDIRRRAHRILLEELASPLSRWPLRRTTWHDALPAESLRLHETTPSPRAGVNWVETYRLHGWPPKAFVGRPRHRVADTLLASVFSWTLDRLALVRADAIQVEPHADAAVRGQLDVALPLRQEEPLLSSITGIPNASDIAAVRREGRPWVAVAQVAELLRDVETSLETWAARLLWPAEDLQPRLFHLAVLGQLLTALKSAGCTYVSKRPLTASAPLPAYEMVDPDGLKWDIWFEAGGMWSHYGRPSPYVEVTSALPGGGHPLAPDLVLARPDDRILIIEVKYSSKSSTVGRGGVTQALAYANEARSELAPAVSAVVIAPDDAMGHLVEVPVHTGTVAVGTPSDLTTLVTSLMQAAVA